jgi:hypothetical protein
MRRMTGRQIGAISVLLVTACLVVSCRNVDSRDSDTPNQSEKISAPAGEKHLQRVTLHITGMS